MHLNSLREHREISQRAFLSTFCRNAWLISIYVNSLYLHALKFIPHVIKEKQQAKSNWNLKLGTVANDCKCRSAEKAQECHKYINWIAMVLPTNFADS